MAFNTQGAYWIEGSEERKNPYFGHTKFKGQDMLQCGELIEKIPPEPQEGPPKQEAGKAEQGKTAPEGQGSESKEGKAAESGGYDH
jgi:hypothetical protein